MSDVAQKTENDTETVLNGTADDGTAVEQIVSNETVAGEEKKQKKKKPNNKSKCGRNV